MRDKYFVINNDERSYQVVDLSTISLIDVQLAESTATFDPTSPPSDEGEPPVEIVAAYTLMFAGGQSLRGTVSRWKEPDLAQRDPKHATSTWVERLAVAFDEYHVIRNKPFEPDQKKLRV